ncbi:D-aminoacylase [Altererythrobacter sp. FM1]|uniref:N-acyl-D-amino-acid deacylase family protein n=1 Tax=Tsuneonella flava TaxID=2055955 RepID=UPI000C803FA0|nr:amidohydrolase family protein [Tsuneonella flava]ROT97035.1 D-aminoacylase [Altererythrobacter sp. FM1]
MKTRLGIAALASLLLASCATPGVVPAEADLLIQGGTVYPGGAEPFTGDVAIKGDRIVAVGPQLHIAAARTINASGMIVAPGFIDPHTHMEGWITADDASRRLVEPFLMQGVTTAFVGNDGGGRIDIGNLLASAKTKPVGINYGSFTGFGTIRAKVIGMDRRAPTDAELAQEKALVKQAMCEGALGLSTGLFYAPQSFSKTDEVIALSRVAGQLGGKYDSHLRDEANYNIGLAAAVDEAIAIARDGHIPVHISHIKALGVDVQGMAPAIIDRIDKARAEGLSITASQYPWNASGTSLVSSLVPLWAQDGGRTAMLARFDDPAQQDRLRADIKENMRRRGGPGSLLIVQGKWRGQRLDAVAKAMNTDPVSAAIAAIRQSDAATISFNMAESDIEAFMRQPWVMTDSDASTAHPRVYGSFARKYAVYVKERKVLTTREFIDRSSATVADWFGLADRGHLRAGAFADVVVFDPQTFASRATYEAPEQTAAGVRDVVVNGALAVADGKLTGTAAGRALPHTPPAGSCQ